jgi:hypothetical protein
MKTSQIRARKKMEIESFLESDLFMNVVGFVKE